MPLRQLFPLLALLLVAPAGAGAAPRAQTEDYRLWGSDSCEDGFGVCFAVRDGETRLELRVEDATGLPMAYTLSFLREGRWSSTGVFACAESFAYGIPDGAEAVRIEFGPVSSAGSAAVIGWCPPAPMAPTVGTVTASFFER